MVPQSADVLVFKHLHNYNMFNFNNID